ncbi:MAG: hypothetical protein IT318_16190 [Anaerolineales bacterium]|nr:hypothetical protein [Anaerolineales bacterium]
MTVGELLRVFMGLARDPSNWHELRVRSKYHLTVPSGPISPEAGWYIICDGEQRPLYVGTAANLDARLNTNNGSRDNFANPRRTSDDVRNFLKCFFSNGLINHMRVVIFPEPVLCAALGARPPLSKSDRENVEKVLGIFRVRVVTATTTSEAN